VRYSAEDARRHGFDVVVVEDACRGIDMGGSIEAAYRALADLAIPRIAADAVG
jgi:nicotinamidase/pyrazinamidase